MNERNCNKTASSARKGDGEGSTNRITGDFAGFDIASIIS